MEAKRTHIEARVPNSDCREYPWAAPVGRCLILPSAPKGKLLSVNTPRREAFSAGGGKKETLNYQRARGCGRHDSHPPTSSRRDPLSAAEARTRLSWQGCDRSADPAAGMAGRRQPPLKLAILA